MSCQTYPNGRAPENETRDEGVEEEVRQDYLQLKAHQADGGAARKPQDYIITIENSNVSTKPFIVQKVNTVEELIQAVCDRVPKVCHPSILLRVSNSRMGTPRRVFYEELLPQDTDSLFVSLTLRKHTG